MTDDIWTLTTALPLLKTLIKYLNPIGYSIGLTGGVLYKEKSAKDLDIIVYPLDSSKDFSYDLIYEVLIKLNFTLIEQMKSMQSRWREKGITDKKHVEVWKYNNLRVDFLFMR